MSDPVALVPAPGFTRKEALPPTEQLIPANPTCMTRFVLMHDHLAGQR